MNASEKPSGILIFGATGSVGSALARQLRGAGIPLALSGRDETALNALAGELDAAPLVADVTRADEVEAAIKAAQESLHELDGIVNCVGSLLLKPGHTTKVEEWDDVIATNLTSAFLIVKFGVTALRKSGGSIVLVSSAAASTGMPNHEAIAAAKAGINGLTRSAAATYANQNIRINCVAPGLVRSKLTEGIFGNELALKASQAMHALPRLGEPEDVAEAIAWLLDSNWVTGQVLGVDGGLASVKTRMKA